MACQAGNVAYYLLCSYVTERSRGRLFTITHWPRGHNLDLQLTQEINQ